MRTIEIMKIAESTLDQGLYFGKGKVYRCIESELITFADKVSRPLEARIVALEERLKLIHKTTSDSVTKSIVRIEEFEALKDEV